MVKTMIVVIGSTITGSIGWVIGKSFGVMTAWMLSVVGTAIGVYYTRKWAAEYLP
jgi:hypothetical protein